jgi:hypothetical protein
MFRKFNGTYCIILQDIRQKKLLVNTQSIFYYKFILLLSSKLINFSQFVRYTWDSTLTTSILVTKKMINLNIFCLLYANIRRHSSEKGLTI